MDLTGSTIVADVVQGRWSDSVQHLAFRVPGAILGDSGKAAAELASYGLEQPVLVVVVEAIVHWDRARKARRELAMGSIILLGDLFIALLAALLGRPVLVVPGVIIAIPLIV